MRGKEDMALFVIYGKENSGKTHACWLIYNLLKAAGSERVFIPSGLRKLTYTEILQHIIDSHSTSPICKATPAISNFKAIFDYKGKKVAIFSAGDMLGSTNPNRATWNEGDVVDFINNLHWVRPYNVDHIVCCARYNNAPGSVRKYLLQNYKLHIYKWYYKTKTAVLNEQLSDAQKIAAELFCDIK